MVLRLMFASAATLALAAAALLAQPQPPAERVATRAEIMAEIAMRASATHPLAAALPAACVPAPLAAPARGAAEI